MSDALVEAPAIGSGARGNTIVLALDARSDVEATLLREWAAQTCPDAQVVDASSPGLVSALDAAPATRVIPVRVRWSGATGHDERRQRRTLLDDVIDGRRPPRALHALMRGRAHVTAGAAGSIADLSRRFAEESGATGPSAFAAFVRQQGLLACDRAERAMLGERFKVPRQVVEQIAGSARFRERVARLAGDLDRGFADVEAEAVSCLQELATVQSPLGVDLFRAFMRPMHANAWTVESDERDFDRLRELSRRHALVFLPTHRSYVDPMVLSGALREHDLAPNHILGGVNMAWWPLGPLGRRAGVVFIRRSFGSDRVYKFAIREFLGYLAAKRLNLEWYIEGGRTRTGKLRPPKLGLLRYLADALEDDRSEDVMLVPVSIVYDRLREVTALSAEQFGATKQREGLRWWVDYLRAQSLHVGKARIHIGEPFLFREALRENAGPAALEKVAFRVCDGINAVTPVTATSVVTLALLGERGRALELTQIRALSRPVLDYAQRRGLRGPVEELRTTTGIERGLESLVDAGVVSRYDGGLHPVWSIAEGHHHVAAFYRNGVLHHLVNRAILEVALLRLTRSETRHRLDQLGWEEALKIRDLLKFEFFFADKERFREQLAEELTLLDPISAAEFCPDMAQALLDGAPMVVAERVLGSFVDSQLIVFQRLADRDPRDCLPMDRDAFLAECLAVGRQALLQGRIRHPEALGREAFVAAIRLADNRDLLTPGRAELALRRRAAVEEVSALRADLIELGQIDEQRRDALLAHATEDAR